MREGEQLLELPLELEELGGLCFAVLGVVVVVICEWLLGSELVCDAWTCVGGCAGG